METSLNRKKSVLKREWHSVNIGIPIETIYINKLNSRIYVISESVDEEFRYSAGCPPVTTRTFPQYSECRLSVSAASAAMVTITTYGVSQLSVHK